MEDLKIQYTKTASAVKKAQGAKKLLDGITNDYQQALKPYLLEFIKANTDLLEDMALARRAHELASREAEDAIEEFEDAIGGWAFGQTRDKVFNIDLTLPGISIEPCKVVVYDRSELFLGALKYAPHLLQLDDDAVKSFFSQNSVNVHSEVGGQHELIEPVKALFPGVGVLPDTSVEIDEAVLIANYNRFPLPAETQEWEEAQAHAEQMIEEEQVDTHDEPYQLEDSPNILNQARNYNAPPPDDKGDLPF